MQAFYTNLSHGTAEHPITIAQALQDAQLHLLRGNAQGTEGVGPPATPTPSNATTPPPYAHPYYHPYYWSAFTIIGNGL
jgi:CHAT domain-containing protein